MPIEQLHEELKILISINTNLKKSINNKIKLETLQAKINYANALYDQLEANLIESEDDLSSSELTFLAKTARNAITEIRNIVVLKLKQIPKKVDANKNITMANEAFDIRQATAIVQSYDGSTAGLETFIDSANLLKELTTAAQVQMAIKFIKTRLSGKARTGLPENINSIDELITNVRNRCKDTTTPDNLIAKLNATKQRGSINTFTDEIESLCTQLENTYITQQIPANVAKTMATKAGITALVNGILSNETKLILKAGNFTSIKEALQKVLDNASENSNNAQMLTTQIRQNIQNKSFNTPQQQIARRGISNRNFSENNRNFTGMNRQFYGRNQRYPGPQRYYNPQNNNGPQRQSNNFSYRGRGRGNFNQFNQPNRWIGNRHNMYIANADQPMCTAQQSQQIPNLVHHSVTAAQAIQPAQLTQFANQNQQPQQNPFLGQMY